MLCQLAQPARPTVPNQLNTLPTERLSNMRNKRFIAAALAAGMLIGVPSAGAAAKLIITGDNIKNGTVTTRDLSEGVQRKLDTRATTVSGAVHGAQGPTGAQGPKGPTGAQGPKGDKGISGLEGAFYATAFYNAGNTNAGAIATVACNADPAKTDYVAISGGVQVLGLGDGANNRNTPVSSSFAGRMDWSTNTPKADRLDGWIIQFGGNAGATSDKAPEKVKVWALCVPQADIPVNNTFTQAG